MRRKAVLFLALGATALLFAGIGRLWPAVPEEHVIDVMPERWARLEKLPSTPVSSGLAKVGDGKETRTARWFLHPQELRGTPMIGADTVIDASDAQQVELLIKRVRLLAVSGRVPMDGLWKYEGGQWRHVELERALQEAIDDQAYNFEGQGLTNVIERDHSTEHSLVTVQKEGDVMPPAERIAFKERGEASWDDVLRKAPGVLERVPNTVLEWYQLKRFPTPDELTLLTAAVAP